MNKFYILAGWLLITLNPFSTLALAQSYHTEHGMHSMHRTRGCSSLVRLTLSPDQRNAIKQIEINQKEKIRNYQQNIIIKRIELRNLIRDDQVSEDVIQQKSEDFAEARHLLYGEIMMYQLAIRKILTPEQLNSWCTLLGENNSHDLWKHHE